MDSTLLIQTIINSISQGSIYAVIAVGLALGFGVMKMANFAHGEFYMVGAYVVYVLYALTGVPYPVASIIAFPFVGIVGILTERFIFKPTRGNVLAGFMATAGLALILQVIAGHFWGFGLMRMIPSPYMGSADVAGVFLGWQRLLIIPITLSLVGALGLFLRYTKWGKALRACAQDPEVASMNGVNIDRMTVLAMFIAGGLAGIAGALMSPIQAVTPYMGHDVILIAFIVVIVGGMASVQGAVLAAFILGFIHVFATTLADAVVADMAGVLLMVVILLFRPQGLLGVQRA